MILLKTCLQDHPHPGRRSSGGLSQ